MVNIDFRSGQPLYRQVKDGFKRLILSGAIGEDERLPSIRELAGSLAINPNTIQRAYRELEAEGFIGTSPGRGVYAMGGAEMKTHRVDEIYAAIYQGVRQLLDIGLDRDAIQQRIGSYIMSEGVTS